MAEAGQRQLLGPHRAAGAVGGLEHEHRTSGLGEPDRGGEPVGPGADDDRVGHSAICLASWWSMLRASSSRWPQNACWASLPAALVGAVEVPRHRVPRAGGLQPRLALVACRGASAVVPAAHEVPAVGREVEADERLAALRHRARLVLAVAGEAVLERLEPAVQRLRVVRRHERGDRHVAAREDGQRGARAGGDLDLERLPVQAAGAQRREAADLAGVVRPGLRAA